MSTEAAKHHKNERGDDAEQFGIGPVDAGEEAGPGRRPARWRSLAQNSVGLDSLGRVGDQRLSQRDGQGGLFTHGFILIVRMAGTNDYRVAQYALAGMPSQRETRRMKSFRLVLYLLVGCWFFHSEPASAQSTAPAYAFPKQYSADQVMTTREGTTMTMKSYRDNDKIRSEMNQNGMQMISIIRLDQQKMYSVMVAQKMVMVMPLNPAKVKQMMPPGSGGDANVETVGPDTVDGVAATKYKITGSDGKVIFLWVNAASQVPLKLASDDGSFTMVWKSFQIGPQDAALFEPPSDYQVMNMPAAPSAPPPGAGQ